MSAGWVAATTRGRALVRRLVGPDGARELATTESWPEARRALSATFYGADLPADADRPAAGRRAVEATTWQLRVLAGWLPPGQSVLARLFAGPFEIANIERRLALLEGRHPDPPIRLGSLAVAWPHVSSATSSEQVRGALATSVWGDPGGTDRTTIALGLRLAWVRRLASQVPEAAGWSKGGAAVLVAREQFAFGRSIGKATGRVVDGLLGRHWRDASSVSSFVDQLPKSASWPLMDVDDASGLWRAEIAIGRRVSDDARRHASSGRYDKTAVAGVMALLLVDLWRLLGAIEVAGRTPVPEEFFDAVA
ncbi:MAG: V-type ATPase subunit [Acidimicrobiia bacterium]|nr:V-type ATPase subunit [Acidimicrobiia bacterium]